MKNALFLITLVFAIGCSAPQEADTIFKNGTIYTMNPANPKVEMVAVKDGAIVYAGTEADAPSFTGEIIDLKGQTMTPGWHEGHAHIMGVGYNQMQVDLMSATSYAESIEMVKERAAKTPKGTWIVGRGWHQDKWTDNPERMFRNMPTHHDLSAAVPDHPVFLKHASGHMALANAKAMELAGITAQSTQPDGGEIFMAMDGPTGIFNETAQFLFDEVLPEENNETDQQALNLAFEECLRNGVTTLHQAGSDTKEIALFKQFGDRGDLKIRLYVMLAGRDGALLKKYFEAGPEMGLYDDRLTIRSVKLYSDGALGSRGAWLLEPYTDDPHSHGHVVTPFTEIDSITQSAYSASFQVCIHAIGDRANREVLDLYERTFEKKLQDDPRFRIEHAQHIDPADIPRFGEMNVIPAMQAIHMASDRPWAIDRLGKQRIEEGAYMWQELLRTGARIVNGSDAPVEPMNPIASYYASVTRKTLRGTPDGGYEPTQAMTREQALRSYTLDAAYGAFMEKKYGSIEVGKVADFTVLDKDLLTIPEEEILKTKVSMTILDGKVAYQAE